MNTGGFKYMWYFVFFDLPVKTKLQRRRAANFRKFLLKDGYIMMQYSVYARPCLGNDGLQKHSRRLMSELPREGQIRTLEITDAQYARMSVYVSKKSTKEEKGKPTQLSFF